MIIITFILLLRQVLPREIDDVSPGIKCEIEYLEKADILWVIPKYQDKPILENKLWCEYILSLNKTLGLHGSQHYFKEFENNLTEEQINEAIFLFEECFGFKPYLFKAPHLALSKENKEIIESKKITVRGQFNQIIHRVYHCDDKRNVPNWLNDII